jgi:capsular polysaccharide biosynthesis protein
MRKPRKNAVSSLTKKRKSKRVAAKQHSLIKKNKIGKTKYRQRKQTHNITPPVSVLDPPTHYEPAPQWVQKAIKKGSIAARNFMELYPNQSQNLKEAGTLHSPLFRASTFTPAPSFVTVVPNGRIYGIGGSVISPDNVLLSDVSVDLRIDHIRNHYAFTSWLSYPVTYMPGTVAHLTFYDSHNYFHWLYDTLARLNLLRISGISIDKYVMNWRNFFGGSAQPFPFQEQALSMLGIAPEQIIETHDHLHLKAKQLVLTSIPINTGYPKWAYDFLRYEFLFKQGLYEQNFSGNERIYISRGNVPNRKIINEEEVIDLLSPYGFRTFVLQDFSLQDQIRLFHSARVIVSPHGAGLANLTFCRPGTTVIEIFGSRFWADMYWKISNYGGLNYYHYVGQSVENPENTLMIRLKEIGENIYVEPEQLKATLQYAGLSHVRRGFFS